MTKHTELVLIGRVDHQNDKFCYSSGEIWCVNEQTLFVRGKQTQAGPRGPGPIATLGVSPRQLFK